MSVSSEIKNLEKVQERCVRFCRYLEKHGNGRYDDLYHRVACVVGSLEEVLHFDEV